MDGIAPQIALLRQMYMGLDKKSRKDETRRYKCKACGRTFVLARNTVLWGSLQSDLRTFAESPTPRSCPTTSKLVSVAILGLLTFRLSGPAG